MQSFVSILGECIFLTVKELFNKLQRCSFLQDLGIIPPTASAMEPCLYDPAQVRATLRTTTHTTVVSKGMVLVDPYLGEDMRLRQSCKKLECAGGWKGGRLCLRKYVVSFLLEFPLQNQER